MTIRHHDHLLTVGSGHNLLAVRPWSVVLAPHSLTRASCELRASTLASSSLLLLHASVSKRICDGCSHDIFLDSVLHDVFNFCVENFSLLVRVVTATQLSESLFHSVSVVYVSKFFHLGEVRVLTLEALLFFEVHFLFDEFLHLLVVLSSDSRKLQFVLFLVSHVLQGRHLRVLIVHEILTNLE